MIGFCWALLVPLVALATPPAPTPLEITSESLRSLVEARNSELSSARAEAEAADERRGSWGRSFLPALEVDAAVESFRSGRDSQKTQPTHGIEARLNLLNGGRDRIEGERRDLGAQRGRVRVTRVFSEELETARTLYWEILYLQEKLLLLDEALATNSRNLAQANRRIKSGVSTDSDRFEFEMNEVDLKRSLAEARLEFNKKRELLALALGLDKDAPASFPEKLGHDHEIDKTAVHDHAAHDFLSKELELEARDLELAREVTSRSWWPKLDAYALVRQHNEREKEFTAPEDRVESAVGLRLSLELAAGFESAREGSARAKEASAARARARRKQEEVEVHLRAEKAELSLLHDQVHEAERNIARAESYYKLTQSEYARGVKNSPDVLGAAEKLFERRHKLLEILRDFQIAKAHFLSKHGR